MLAQNQIQFLQEKIADIKSALFFSQNNAVLKFPTTIVSVLTVDEAGQIWFFLNRPSQSIQEFDKEFPVRLDFFQKGKDHHMQVTGKAFIINDPEEMNYLVSLPEDVKNEAMQHKVLVKVKILKADYFERINSTGHWWVTMFNRVYNKLFSEKPGYRPHSFHPGNAAVA